jgi:hypothetical protein
VAQKEGHSMRVSRIVAILIFGLTIVLFFFAAIIMRQRAIVAAVKGLF